MIYNKCKNINYMKKNYEIAKNDYLTKLTKKIFNYFDNDIETHFNEILGNEEDIFNNIYEILENAIFLKKINYNCYIFEYIAKIEENKNFYKNIYRGIYGKKIQ